MAAVELPPVRGQPGRRWGAALAAIYLAGLLLLAISRGPIYLALWGQYSSNPIMGRDFRGSCWVGAHALGQGYQDIYRDQAFAEWQRACGIRYFFPQEYPPLTYVLYQPFGSMPAARAAWLNFLVEQALLVLTVLGGIPLLLAPAWGPRAGLLAGVALLPLALLSSPTVDCLLSGQMGIPLLFLLTAFAVLYLRGLPVAATLPLALAASLKLAPAVFGIYFAVKRDLRALAAFLAWMLALLVPVLAFTGSARLFLDYLQVLPSALAPKAVYANQSFSGFFSKLFLPTDYWSPLGVSPWLGRLATLGAVAGSALYTFGRVDPYDRRPFRLAGEVGAVLLAHLLWLGRSWPHYHVYGILALALYALAVSPSPRRGALLSGALALFVALGFFDGETGWDVAEFQQRRTWLSWHLPFLLLLGAWGGQVAWLGPRRRVRPE
jgi:alpha-1,2-mannosyltransferase